MSEQVVRVPKGKLIETVRRNRDEHRAIFLEAQDRYREQVIALLDKRLAQVRAGKPIDLRIALPEPVDYTSEYDAALDQLDWEVRDEIELDRDDFNRLVRNEWSWARHFAANTQSYTVG